ncbi:bifunctional 2-keto-4-hydroxyglutarate aldolase/2-keto-3-deoxy-6-phosphogluconate aldolase [Clostridium oryzae]|uniref:KHG/KDPG aldolase n=1 Tax=Clostridium oryzae TaxID=1450648 RepID=A0A1V4IQ73_9CLOT|nr:bifunctional 2-keto-4-hydroxyglutarate aldolase/2-keto-3-deoxy-6-phosphogluconate aldolase [Clostridium oryzae]OPJ61945.1 KHG/KDPG aldolase [Clostridium oryzae]
MEKYNTLRKILDSGIVAVVRGNSKEEAIKISEACINGGVNCIEITFTVPEADDAIKEINHKYKDVVVGAGTVLDECTARIAIMAGAKFVVSPCFDEASAKMCNLYQIPYMPGCMTINEMKTALKSGVDIVKFFPGNAYKPEIVKAWKAPMPQLNIMVTGGVNLDNIEKWFNSGVAAVGAGSNLTGLYNGDDYSGITDMAKKYIEKIKEIKGR